MEPLSEERCSVAEYELYELNRKTSNGTLNRYKKDSFYWYKKVIATNGEDLE
jgi:beta-glucosidase/6-phospho-beta-glucosidase/beta-galactosidase